MEIGMAPPRTLVVSRPWLHGRASVISRSRRIGATVLSGVVVASIDAAEPPSPPGTPSSGAVTGEFARPCAVCHDNAEPGSRAPSRETLGQFMPERVLAAITTGPMATHAQGMSEEQKRALAELVSGKPFGGSAARAAAA